MSLKHEIFELNKKLDKQIENMEISFRAISVLFTKIAAMKFPPEMKISSHADALSFIEGGLWQRLEAIIAELETTRAEYVRSTENHIWRVIEKADRQLVEDAEQIERAYMKFEQVKNFKFPHYMNTENYEQVLAQITFS
jgi:hypothetical protein